LFLILLVPPHCISDSILRALWEKKTKKQYIGRGKKHENNTMPSEKERETKTTIFDRGH
jgi:hypothetical protein